MPKTSGPEVAGEADLYAVVPEQFVAARDTFVRRLRSAGDKAKAARIAKLRRPPLTTWALNQVARNVPALIEELLDAGGILRSAMEKALRGDASDLRQARATERSAVDAIVDEAGRRIDEAGYTRTDVMNQRMAATLRAAIVDESVANLLQDGVLDRDQDAPGFGMDSLTAPLTLVPPGADDGAGDEPPDEACQDQADVAERARRRQKAVDEADRLAAEGQVLEAEADRLEADAHRLANEAKVASDASEAARTRAAAAREAADVERRVADHLA
ncbi:MAG: hypothetical protein QOE15_1670 [Acidimicrobiaceae bacterium]|nr:hypothetical protein [Acidimicrobiaceae bacterium]